MPFYYVDFELAIQSYRWLNIPRQDRVCILCNNRNICVEYHYLFECKCFAQKRKECLPKYFITRPNTLKFSELMSTRSKPIKKKLCKFIRNLNANLPSS
jgi:hypothetical protein